MDLQNESHCAEMLNSYQFESKNPVREMYLRQKLYQESVAIKNNTTLDNLVGNVERCFYWLSCLNIELLEMIDWYKAAVDLKKTHESDEKIQEIVLEAQFEYIDAYHFLMNFFIYSNVDDVDVDFFKVYGDIENTDIFNDAFFDKLYEKIGRFNMHLAEQVNQTDFKTWKKRSPVYTFDKNSKDLFTEFFKLGTFLNISKQHFYNLYRSKLEENHRRQSRGGKYFER